MLVEDVMTRQPPVSYRGDPVIAAVRLMVAYDLRGIPVVDKGSKLVGVLSADDLMRWEAQRGTSRWWTRRLERPVLVAHVMDHESIATSPSESISEAARVMRFAGRSVLPVLDPGRTLVGMVAANDIAAAYLRSDDSIRREVNNQLRLQSNASFEATTDLHVEDGTVTVSGVRGSHRDQRTVLRAIATVTGVSGIRTDLHREVEITTE